MLSSSDLLTLVLPIKGRAEFTFRIMEYFDHGRFPFKVIIADGGDDGAVSSALSRAGNFPNVDYRYVKYPFDESYLHYYRKMVSALLEVRTPYAFLIDNDCFPVIEGLHESVAFLESHPGYSTCRGQHIDFHLNSFSNNASALLYGSSISINPDYFDRKNTIWSSFESDSPLERILEWSHCMNVMFYNVHRTRTLIEAWEFLSVNDCLDLILCELATALSALVCGKSKVIDIPFIMKQQNSPDSVSKDMIRRMDILDRVFVEKWTRDINQLINHIAHKVSGAGVCVQSEAAAQVKIALKNHYADRLYSYLIQRNMANGSINAEDMPSSQGLTSGCNVKDIVISQPEEAHSSLRQIVSFLMKGQLKSFRVL